MDGLLRLYAIAITYLRRDAIPLIVLLTVAVLALTDTLGTQAKSNSADRSAVDTGSRFDTWGPNRLLFNDETLPGRAVLNSRVTEEYDETRFVQIRRIDNAQSRDYDTSRILRSGSEYQISVNFNNDNVDTSDTQTVPTDTVLRVNLPESVDSAESISAHLSSPTVLPGYVFSQIGVASYTRLSIKPVEGSAFAAFKDSSLPTIPVDLEKLIGDGVLIGCRDNFGSGLLRSGPGCTGVIRFRFRAVAATVPVQVFARTGDDPMVGYLSIPKDASSFEVWTSIWNRTDTTEHDVRISATLPPGFDPEDAVNEIQATAGKNTELRRLSGTPSNTRFGDIPSGEVHTISLRGTVDSGRACAASPRERRGKIVVSSADTLKRSEILIAVDDSHCQGGEK
ncbi:Uncharacterised protein (plasmid) [Tsukamurella tyrosinosolvens]|uniref:Uncharacterized protein n=1 Tax=Tsukamurella tyrosinosolvens TaxID=57704 RepID=A0A1H4QXR3_TSUTY|nr:hypothetical protein [Tsukamurella tyrosinosolvens]SEC24251.1 hypothetical protein SAMN04489793_1874 [Tsukamurella tyrosinosolvens]VEH92380.1 Uncharacterised protein [Tsukamurella tyrosinosolvens]